MRAAYIQSPWDAQPAPLRRRAASLALVIAVHALLLLLLLRLAPPVSAPPKRPAGPLTVDLLPDTKEEAKSTKAETKQNKASGGAPKNIPAPTVRPVQDRPDAADAEAAAIWSKVIRLSKQEMAQSDVARMPSRPDAKGGTGKGTETASADGAPSGGGGGPNGETLYPADWYRRPTDAELSTYIPPNAPRIGWGAIACKTVAGFRVEDCVEIGQSPAGSGFSRAVLNAAWQFRVLPPRISGKPQIGSWVSIRIDYTESGVRIR